MQDDLIRKMSGRKWGQWWLDTTLPPSLNFPLPWEDTYWIALYRCRTVNERRLWVEHMAEKRYITRQDLIDLRQALDDLVAVGLLPDKNGQRGPSVCPKAKRGLCLLQN